MRSPLYIVAILALVLSGCSPADDDPAGATPGDASSPDVAGVAKGYKGLQLMTPSPVFVNPELAMLCRGASQEDVEAATKKFGIHAYTRINIYMNALAAKAFAKPKPTYPVGSIIVKQKQGQSYNTSQGKPGSTHDGVGGMIKRPPGYDPPHGDWEYFYFEDVSKIETGKIDSCVKCHAAAADRDRVFGSWSRGG